MRGTNRPPFTADIQDVSERPFALPADSIEITLDLPMPTSANKLWRHNRNSRKPFCSKEYLAWKEHADMSVMAARQFPKCKIQGLYEMQVLLNNEHGGDGDNRLKAIGDWLQSRDIVRNDRDCRKGSWEWIEPERAPKGCRVILRSLHG